MSVRGRGGFILVAVLWALAVFGILAALFLADSIDLLRIGANRQAEIRARYAADAGVERARNVLEALHGRELIDRERGARRTSHGMLRAWNRLDSVFAPVHRECLATACVELRVYDLGARLNVNRADEKMLERFFRALGAEPTEALIAAQSVADWIDADDDPRRFGAERSFYALVAGSRLPSNAPLHDPAELRGVRGMHPGLLARALPHLTVHGSGRINVNTAPAPVLAALPGLEGAPLAGLMALRRQDDLAPDLGSLTRALGRERIRLTEGASGIRRGAVFAARDLEVVSTGYLSGSAIRVTRRAVLRREADERVSLVLRWLDPY